MPLEKPLKGRRTVTVIKTEEKGSDVNLAVHLLNDAWKDSYDCAVVISNDSDMAEGMRLARKEHPRKRFGLITPGSRRASHQLREHADFALFLNNRVLRNSQLPNPIPGMDLHKPENW